MNNSISVLNKTLYHASSNITLVSSIDPNWFYSAVAQSSAAIVGITGAFLTTKLINQKTLIKKIETEIKDDKAKIRFLNEKIRGKEEWINQIDREEDLKNVKDFLNDIIDQIDSDNPPSIDELLQMANESENEDYHNLNRELLESSFNEEYIAEVKDRINRSNLPFGFGNINLPANLLISPSINHG